MRHHSGAGAGSAVKRCAPGYPCGHSWNRLGAARTGRRVARCFEVGLWSQSRLSRSLGIEQTAGGCIDVLGVDAGRGHQLLAGTRTWHVPDRQVGDPQCLRPGA
jgi:hypothetical protein